jgi:membrane-bound metal-dependent hydrolase YbcI (DUF457 family)
MFIGHFGLSFAAKKVAPQLSLGTLFIATQFVDILWPFLLLLNIEKVAITPGYTKMNSFEFLYYPYTHSLFMNIFWGALIGIIYWLIKKDIRGAVVIAVCVFSHWFLDLIVHTTDLPFSPFSDEKAGFGLWNNIAATMVVEAVIFFVGLYIYTTFTQAKNKIGKWALLTLVILLMLITISNTFGPPPPDSIMTLFISFIIIMTIFISLAYWTDKNRTISNLNQ